MKSYIGQLKELLKALEHHFSDFYKDISVQQLRDDPYSPIVLIGPKYFYNTDISDEQKRKQISLLKLYKEWEEHFNLLTSNMPERTLKEITEIEEYLRNKINLKSGWETEATPEENLSGIYERIESLRKVLNLFEHNDPIITLIPDTNALIIDPDFDKYKCIAGDSIEILICSTVLRELDKLKMNHKNEEFKKKVESVIKRLKGLRNQGKLTEGVVVNSSIRVKMSAKETSFCNTLSWLDSNNDDDRIVAFTLEYLREYPSRKVIVVTGDINLQNKLEMAKLEYSEPPSKVKK